MSPAAPNLLIVLLKYSAFLVIPGVTMGLGIWLINRYVKKNERYVFTAWAALFGIIIFEFFALGVLFNPRTDFTKWKSLLNTGVLAALWGFLLAMVFIPGVSRLIRLIRDIGKPKEE
jgi:hypothetical protein